MAKKKIRFSALVKASGKPVLVSLWTRPEQNRPFMKAVKENRVLTVKQESAASRRDFGRIGFHQAPHSAYLVFPEALPHDRESRVIGVKYDLIEQPEVTDPVRLRNPRGRRAKSVAPKAPARPQIAARPFNVLIRRTAVIETTVPIASRKKSRAKQKALGKMRNEPFELAKAVFRNEVLAIE